MKTTEQLAALEMMAVNPIQRVIAPRLIAGIITVPLLCAMFTFVGDSGWLLYRCRSAGCGFRCVLVGDQ